MVKHIISYIINKIAKYSFKILIKFVGYYSQPTRKTQLLRNRATVITGKVELRCMIYRQTRCCRALLEYKLAKIDAHHTHLHRQLVHDQNAHGVT